jgi:hypothetical protein
MGRISDHVLHTLAKVTADAKAGSIEALAIIAVGPDGAPRVMFAGAGELAPSIYLGAGIAQKTILDQAGAPQMNSGIIVPEAH